MPRPFNSQTFRTLLQTFYDPDRERCGVVDPSGEIIETPNLADDPTDRFRFDPAVLETALATWHTHRGDDANLSIPDWHFFKSWPNIPHFIVASKEVRCYLSPGDGLVYLEDDEDYHPSRPSGGEAS